MIYGLIALGLYSVIVTIVLYVLLYFWGKERNSYRSAVDREWRSWREMMSGVSDKTPEEFLEWVDKDFRTWIHKRYLD